MNNEYHEWFYTDLFALRLQTIEERQKVVFGGIELFYDSIVYHLYSFVRRKKGS